MVRRERILRIMGQSQQAGGIQDEERFAYDANEELYFSQWKTYDLYNPWQFQFISTYHGYESGALIYRKITNGWSNYGYVDPLMCSQETEYFTYLGGIRVAVTSPYRTSDTVVTTSQPGSAGVPPVQ
jgi:hypothetical protein